ncbi:hypothetical protein MmiHf6_12740 [Methanimicrococcus hongohii]|uniref:Uncharacterized protein n=1 Tax=Methanimicrococcus hongohii TaxID=3028295 RepID=A0AA96V139_9EURY|nr:hypothetical protein MmiHf6_12740 [Methanimicrococcus sp. Hf6]
MKFQKPPPQVEFPKRSGGNETWRIFPIRNKKFKNVLFYCCSAPAKCFLATVFCCCRLLPRLSVCNCLLCCCCRGGLRFCLHLLFLIVIRSHSRTCRCYLQVSVSACNQVCIAATGTAAARRRVSRSAFAKNYELLLIAFAKKYKQTRFPFFKK